jgi:23S rRNA maturation mini-RNase III
MGERRKFHMSVTTMETNMKWKVRDIDAKKKRIIQKRTQKNEKQELDRLCEEDEEERNKSGRNKQKKMRKRLN